MADYQPDDIQSIMRFARRLRGKRLDEVIEGLEELQVSSAKTKGLVGHLYERFFGIPMNSLAQPDFNLAGVELKIVPMAGPATALRVKERTSITSINYRAMADVPFSSSHLESKTRAILFIFYEWVANVPISRFKTLEVDLWHRKDFDQTLMEFAYGYVRKKVLEGAAHTISEGDTQGIGAATKGAGGSWVTQPFSGIPARPRGFAFKPPFTLAIWADLRRRLESIGDLDAISPLEFEDRFLARLHPYRGMSVRQIASRLAVEPSVAKNWLATLSRRMAGAPQGRRDIEELKKMGVTMRTIRIDENGRPREDVSFPAIDFLEVIGEDWESSSLREQLSEMLFVVFRQPRSDDLPDARFEGAFFWRFTVDEETIMQKEWRRFLKHIREGDLANRPQASATQILHIRPHGRDGRDVAPLPTGASYVKSSFWLNKDFVARLIKGRLPS